VKQMLGKALVTTGAQQASGSLGRLVGCVALLCALVAPVPAAAGDPPGLGRKVTLMAREQPLAAFLQELFASIEVPVSVSPTVQGVVNGRFEGSAQSVFRDISRSFSLSGYYDGVAMHLYPASEIGTRTYATDPIQAARILRTANELSLPDARNTMRTTQGGTLVAIGGPRFVQQIDDLVRADGTRAQAPPGAPAVRGLAGGPANAAPGIGFRVFYLKHAWAQDTRLTFGGRQTVIPGVASVLRSITAGLGQTVTQPLPLGAGVVAPNEGFATASDRLMPPVQPRLKGTGLAGAGQQTGRMPTLGDTGDDATVVVGPRSQAGVASAVGADGLPVLQRYVVSQVGAARIEADTRSNAIIVRDVIERLPMYDELIASLDVAPQMIEVEATIVDVNISRLEQLGINWRWINGRNEVLFGNGTASDLLLNAGQKITPSGAGMVVSTVLGNSFNFISRINALTTDGAARVVSRPQLVTLSNVEALFDSSSTFYVRVAGREQVDLFNVSAGTALRVTPNVFRDGDGVRIKLMVAVEDGRISGESVDQIPVVDRATINTQALMLEGESLLIGGMTREGSDRRAGKVPLLGDLPGVGALFRTKEDNTTRIERLILITPRLIDGQRVLASVGTQRVQAVATPQVTPVLEPGAALLSPPPNPVALPGASTEPAGPRPAASVGSVRGSTTVPAATRRASVFPAERVPEAVAPAAVVSQAVAPAAVAPVAVSPKAVVPAAVAPTANVPEAVAPVAVAPTEVAPTLVAPPVIAPASIEVMPSVTHFWSTLRRDDAARPTCPSPGGVDRC
jgi:type III secretion protein C